MLLFYDILFYFYTSSVLSFFPLYLFFPISIQILSRFIQSSPILTQIHQYNPIHFYNLYITVINLQFYHYVIQQYPSLLFGIILDQNMQKKSFNSYAKRQLQVFSQMMQMKFKPRSNIATTTLVSKNKQLIQKIQKKNNNEMQYSRSTISHMTNRDKKLKYLHSLSSQYFLIGNENQIDMICIIGITHSFVDTDYCWSLSLPGSGSIDCMAVQPKKCLLAIVSDKKLYFYKYNLKKNKQQPQLVKQFQIKPQTKYIQFPKDSLLGLFCQKDFQIYNVEQINKIYKKVSKPYNQPQNFKLFAVPQVVENSLKVFFIQQSNQQKTFGLWYLRISIQLSSIGIEKPQKVYDIKRNLKKFLVIQNFSKDIIFMNIGAQILAAKSGYILDSANVSLQSGNAKLKYINNQRLIHISDKKVEIYKMNILTNVTPNKIQISPIDALQIVDKPPQSQFFGIVPLINNNFVVFYQNLSQYNIYTKGQATYWFAMTQSIPLQSKIEKIFDYGEQISKINPETLQSKCDMARKMGLNQKQLYLQIWNRSSKNSIADYQFILATRNYKTIHTQIQRKLKKQSMSFRELLKIEESCLQILKESVYGSKCTEENIQQFLTSHCFIKKLKLFKDIELYRKKVRKSTIRLAHDDEQDNNKLLINIQQYYEYKQFDIKNYLVEKIVDFCVYDKESKGMQIRMMLRTFKFIYRVIYPQILQEIIKICKGKLIILLENIPQILPYTTNMTQDQLQKNQQLTLYQGIWNDIKQYEWERNLFVQNITTIDNKQTVKDFAKSIWYRRYWLTAHQLANITKEKIIQINAINNSEHTFYFFVSKLFQLISDQSTQFDVIFFLEQHYSRIPQHLKGKIFLHYNLHKFYIQNHAKAKLQYKRLDQFLNLNDAQLFEYFFIQEKHTKNCILKNIKRIYEETCQQGEGLNLFNQGLLAYFKSDLSQISDLKYLLNRMNNEKTQFHQANLSIYEVLVRAMEFKLKLGSDKDIPIDEVLMYIEHIPISQDNQVMKQLYIVKRINEEAERFKKMKINMTVKQIIDNCEDVITKIIEYEFEENKIRKIRDQATLKQKSYKILAEVLVVKEKIYGQEEYSNLPFFIYLTKLLQEKEQIKLAEALLHDQFLNGYFTIDEVMKQNLVLYMYKWIFNKNSTFNFNSEYIKELLSLLPQQNENRKFIQSELLFATTLSTIDDPLQYPISTQAQYPGIHELQQILKFTPIDHILKVDIEQVYEAMSTMECISLKQLESEEQDIGVSTIQKITLHQVYSVFINKYIQENHLNDVIPLIKKILEFQISNKRYNMIFFIFLIKKLSKQLNDESKNVMVKMISYCYDQPQVLFQYIDYYFTSKQTALEKSKKLKSMMQRFVKNKINFSKTNILFNKESRDALSKKDMTENSKTLINHICSHLRLTKHQFQVIDYDLIFSMLCNQPYLVVKYILANRYHLNFKTLRLYLSFLINESIFDQTNVIDFSKKIFSMLLQSNIKHKVISRMILNPDKFSFNWYEIKQIGIEDQVDLKILKTLKSFEKKKRSLGVLLGKKKPSSRIQSDPQVHQIHLQLKNPQQLQSKQPSQYPFSDSDNEGQQAPTISPSKIALKKKKKKQSKEFQPKKQRNTLLKRKNSFFNDKTSQRRKSRNSSDDQFLQQPLQLSNKSITLKVPDKKPIKIYVKRTLTSENSLNIKKNISSITQKDSIESQSKLIRKKQSIKPTLSNQHQQSRLSKQQSQYSVNQISEVQEQDPSYRIKDLIIKNYIENDSKIDFQILAKQQTHHDFATNLKQVIVRIFEQKDLNNVQKISIIKQICQKYKKKPVVNIIFLAVYENIQKIEEKYNLGLPINRMLPVQGLFIDSKVFDDLFKVILPRIIQISTDETIYKLSKLISLGFRKNVYEVQISFQYIKKMINEFGGGDSQVELNMRFEIMKSLVGKMSIMSLKQRAGKLVDCVIANPGLQQKIIQNVVDSVKKRGDASAAQEIRKIMNKTR